MLVTTRKQREALKAVYDRAPLTICHNRVSSQHERAISYREFRRKAYPVPGHDSYIAVRWCGMWIGIEKDGYTHS